MKLNKERKIYVGLGLLAFVGLTVDRVIIGTELTGPSPAAASLVDDLSVQSLPDSLVSWDPSMTQDHHGVALRLRAVSSSMQPGMLGLRDAFRPDESWFQAGYSPPSDSDPDRLLRFQKNHRLDAIMVIDGVAYAVMDGQRMLTTGDRLEGFEVISVTARSARFRHGDEQVEFALENGV